MFKGEKFNADTWAELFETVDASFGGTKGANHWKVTRNTKFIGEEKEPFQVFEEKYQRSFITYLLQPRPESNKDVESMYMSNSIPLGVGTCDLKT